MNRFLSKKTISKFKTLGIYQIIGGSIGALLVLWGLLSVQQFSGLIILYLFILVFFGFSIYCGTLCLKTKNNSLRFSLINQILQVIGIAMFGLTFKYAAGVYFSAGLNLTESFNLTFGAGVSKFDFNFNNENERLEVDFNFIALGLIIFIERLKKIVKEENDKNQVSSIGAT
jgi:hypothetical protein